MKKSSEMDVVKNFAAATIIPVVVFACVIVRVVLSQSTYRDFAVARALGQADPLSHQQAEQNDSSEDRGRMHILVTDTLETKDNLPQQSQQPVKSEPAETMKDQPELNLLLISVFSGSPLDAMALIEDLKSNSVGVYKIGQQIGTGHIAGIRKNKVVVVDRGRRFILEPAFSQSHSVSVPATAAPAAIQTSRSIPIGSRPSLAAYEDYRTPVASLKSVLSGAKLEPFSFKGQVQGLKVSALDSTLVANEMNIRQGDVIHRINGHLLINKQQAWQVLKKAKSQETIDVEVLYDD